MTGLSALPSSRPVTVDAPSSPESSESSPKYSGVRPDSGVRPLAMPGPSTPFLPLSKDSAP